MIAVTGASGALGRRVADRLAGRSHVPLRLVVRDAARAPEVPGAEVVANPGGFDDPAGLEAALRGADTVYLVSAAEHERRLQQLRRGRRGGDGRRARGSSTPRTSMPPPTRSSPLVRQHFATEERIRQGGVRATFPRHSMYADFVPFFASVEDGQAVIAAPRRRRPHELRVA